MNSAAPDESEALLRERMLEMYRLVQASPPLPELAGQSSAARLAELQGRLAALATDLHFQPATGHPLRRVAKHLFQKLSWPFLRWQVQFNRELHQLLTEIAQLQLTALTEMEDRHHRELQKIYSELRQRDLLIRTLQRQLKGQSD